MSTYQTVSTTAWAGASSVVITKPTGLAVGDLLLALLVNVSGIENDFTLPAGWTSYANTTLNNSGGPQRLTVFYKVAESADVAASNFTFTQGSASRIAGALLRLDNYGFIDQTAKTDFTNKATPLSPITGVTPTRVNELFLLMALGAELSGTDPTYSGYNIATSNPTWTEIFDLSDGPATGGFACAYATRAAMTATGSASITLDTAPTNGDYITRIISIAPKVSGSATPATITDSYFRIPPHIQPIKNLIYAVGAVTTVIKDNVIQWATNTKPSTTYSNTTKPSATWSNTTKPTTSWTNPDK